MVKKYFYFALMMLMAVLTGCKQEELVFDYEKLHFDTKPNAILLEVVVPSSTAATDEIYVVGDFCDNKIAADFQLMKHDETNIKYGIYLYPEDFVGGKTLADGFTFFNKKQGYEKATEKHVIANAQLGERYTISFGRWAGLEGGDEPIEPGEYEHLYVTGNIEGSSWDPAAPIELEMVGTDIFRAELTFTAETSYFAFSTAKGEWADFNAGRWGGAANDLLVEGAVVDLVNEGEPCVTIAQGTYTITVNMAKKQVAIGEGDWSNGGGADKFPTIAHDGQDIVFAADNAAWGIVTLYMWGDINNLDRDGGDTAGWPGLQPDGEFDFAGLHWYYFLMGAANSGKTENMILNNNNGGSQTGDINVTLAEGNAYYYIVNADKSVTVVEDPETYDFGGGSEEPGEEPAKALINIFVYDATTPAFNAQAEGVVVSMYAWGASEIFGGWPGLPLSDWEDYSLLGLQLKKFTIECTEGATYNLILNNKKDDLGNMQYDAFAVTAEGAVTDVYYKLTDTAATPLQVAALAPTRR